MTRPMNALTFFVPGDPRTQGSMKAFVIPSKIAGMRPRAMVTHDKSPELMSWRSAIAGIAHNAAKKHGFEKIEEGPVTMELRFFLSRPKSVSRSVPWTKPDADKLERAVMDALTGVLYHDDAQVTDSARSKRYAEDGAECGVEVTISAEARPLSVMGKQGTLALV